MGRLGAILGRLGAVLGPPWGRLGAILGRAGPSEKHERQELPKYPKTYKNLRKTNDFSILGAPLVRPVRRLGGLLGLLGALWGRLGPS